MTKLKIFALSLMMLGMFIVTSATTFAGRQDFVLVNQTGRDIVNLYITPSKSYYWNDDILGVDILGNGESTEIVFDRKETNKYWSMMATFSDGNDFVWEDIDLFSISKITLRFDGLAIEE